MEIPSLDNSLPHLLEDVDNWINSLCNKKTARGVNEDRLVPINQWHGDEALTMAPEQTYNIKIKQDYNASPIAVQVLEESSADIGRVNQ